MSDLENEIFEVWKELEPNDAYLQGLDEYAGILFVHTPKNKGKILEKIEGLISKSDDRVQIKFLTSLKAGLIYREPPNDLSDILWTLFGHLIKGGINPNHMSALLDFACESLKNSENIYNLDELPIEYKIILTNKCNSLLGILTIIGDKTEDSVLKEKIEKTSQKIGEYKDIVAVKGLKKGDFSEVFPILKQHSKGDMGRQDHYEKMIKELYDYYESPDEIEEKALSWLDIELPKLNKTAEELAGIYMIGPDIESVEKEIAKQRNISKSTLMEFIKDFRKKTQKVTEKHLVRINPKYNTKILETPDYLLTLIPTAAMTVFDSLTDEPFSVFFVTTDEKRSPPAGFPDIFQMIVHEEYGHCVNFSNSAMGFAAKPNLVEMLNSKLHYPISEGISFHRELETVELIEKLAQQPREELSHEEKELLEALEKLGDLDIILLESRFVIHKWRIIRFLRAISDVRINLNRQSLCEFVEWASERTGFSQKTIYDQIFIFQENPGYAPCYSIAGMALKDIQDEARKKGKDILEFNTVASSLGFPPRTVWEERLREF